MTYLGDVTNTPQRRQIELMKAVGLYVKAGEERADEHIHSLLEEAAEVMARRGLIPSRLQQAAIEALYDVFFNDVRAKDEQPVEESA